MALKQLFTLLCEYTLVDQHGKRGYLGVMSNLDIHSEPGRTAPFVLAMNIQADVEDGFRIVIADRERTWESLIIQGGVKDYIPPTQEPFFGFILEGKLDGGMEFPRAGGYEIVLQDGDLREVHSAPFGVRVVPRPSFIHVPSE